MSSGTRAALVANPFSTRDVELDVTVDDGSRRVERTDDVRRATGSRIERRRDYLAAPDVVSDSHSLGGRNSMTSSAATLPTPIYRPIHVPSLLPDNNVQPHVSPIHTASNLARLSNLGTGRAPGGTPPDVRLDDLGEPHASTARHATATSTGAERNVLRGEVSPVTGDPLYQGLDCRWEFDTGRGVMTIMFRDHDDDKDGQRAVVSRYAIKYEGVGGPFVRMDVASLTETATHLACVLKGLRFCKASFERASVSGKPPSVQIDGSPEAAKVPYELHRAGTDAAVWPLAKHYAAVGIEYRNPPEAWGEILYQYKQLGCEVEQVGRLEIEAVDDAAAESVAEQGRRDRLAHGRRRQFAASTPDRATRSSAEPVQPRVSLQDQLENDGTDDSLIWS